MGGEYSMMIKAWRPPAELPAESSETDRTSAVDIVPCVRHEPVIGDIT